MKLDVIRVIKIAAVALSAAGMIVGEYATGKATTKTLEKLVDEKLKG